MTFSLVGKCARTEMFGAVVTTSSICVGARCPHARPRTGAVMSQNITDPGLGTAVLDALQRGLSATEALAEVVGAAENTEYRQLTVVAADGSTSNFTGSRILGTNAVSSGSNCVAAGNLLANARVPGAMVTAFAGHSRAHLAERLLVSLEAGVAAGGEEGPVHSAALLVVDRTTFPLVDLRVDWDDHDPVGLLRRLWSAYEPQMDDYLRRALDPESAPSYGVAGDP